MQRRIALWLAAAITLAQAIQPGTPGSTPAPSPYPPVPASLPPLGPGPSFTPPPAVPGQFSPPPVATPSAVNGNGIIGPGLPPGVAAPPNPDAPH
jgi:hypothetical protein